jgi:CO/xanthine dehydrogenase Mo-binding subunit
VEEAAHKLTLGQALRSPRVLAFASNFHDYVMLRMDEAPQIEIEIVSGDEEPGRPGEPGTSALAPAALNSVHAASGIRW